MAEPPILAGSTMVTQASTGIDPFIVAALMRLPARQRQVIALRVFLDLDTARAADAPVSHPAPFSLTWAAPSLRYALTLTENYRKSAGNGRRRADHTWSESSADKVPLTIPVEEIISAAACRLRLATNGKDWSRWSLSALVLGGTGAFVSSRIGTPPSRPSPNALRGHVSPPWTAPGWRLVADINPAWRAVQAAGFEAAFLVCPSRGTCYAENLSAARYAGRG